MPGTVRFMLEMVVGREAELAEIDGFVAAVRSGSVALGLHGEAGIGKTTLWRECVRRAEGLGCRLLSCTAVAAEAKLSYGGLGDLLAAVPEEALAMLPAPQRRALEVVLLRADARGRAPGRREVAVGVLSLLRGLAEGSPVLVAVDDAQWLDAATASLLAFVARRLDTEPVGILAAVRLDGDPVDTFDTEVGRARRRVVRIGSLSLGALQRVLHEQLGHSLTRPVLVRIEQASGGNPFYALEIARALGDGLTVSPGSSLPVPDDLRQLLMARIRRLPTKTRDALLVLAALPTPAGELVEERALNAAVEAGVLAPIESGRLDFAHPLYRTVVYSSTSLRARRELHGRLACVVEDLEERARHVALATIDADEEVAEALEQGAASARSRGGWEAAGGLLERAQELTPSERPDRARQRGVRAAEHYVHAGDRPRARVLLEAILAEAPPGSARGDALRLLAEISYNESSFAEAEVLLEQALEHADDPRLAVTIELALAFVRTNLCDYERAAVHARRGLALAKTIGERALLAQALASCAMMDYLRGRGVDWATVERAVALEQPDQLMPLTGRPSTVAAFLLLYVGRLSEARERMLAVRATAVEQGDESDLAFVGFWLVWLETLSGNFDDAAEFAEEAALTADLTGSTTSQVWVHAQRGLLSAHRGDVDAARGALAEATALAERVGWATSSRWIVAATVLLELSLGDPQAAWSAAEPLAELAESDGIGEPVDVLFLPDALEALVMLGELDRAQTLLEAFEHRARELDRVWALATGWRCRGLVLAARGDLSSAEAALERALVEHGRLEMPFELARTLLCLGQVQRRRKERKAARATLANALERFEALGATLWTQRARSELGRIGVRRAPGQLTAAELAVAELAAAGRRNREIAAELFISRRTVEASLARAYHKLGISSRAELGAKMAERSETASRS